MTEHPDVRVVIDDETAWGSVVSASSSPAFIATGGKESREAMLGSSIPSARLEQDAQRFGFLERVFPGSMIRSPQQMQILGFILVSADKAPSACPGKASLQLIEEPTQVRDDGRPALKTFNSPIHFTEPLNDRFVKRGSLFGTGPKAPFIL
jgi:hypothetical protein